MKRRPAASAGTSISASVLCVLLLLVCVVASLGRFGTSHRRLEAFSSEGADADPSAASMTSEPAVPMTNTIDMSSTSSTSSTGTTGTTSSYPSTVSTSTMTDITARDATARAMQPPPPPTVVNTINNNANSHNNSHSDKYHIPNHRGYYNPYAVPVAEIYTTTQPRWWPWTRRSMWPTAVITDYETLRGVDRVCYDEGCFYNAPGLRSSSSLAAYSSMGSDSAPSGVTTLPNGLVLQWGVADLQPSSADGDGGLAGWLIRLFSKGGGSAYQTWISFAKPFASRPVHTSAEEATGRSDVEVRVQRSDANGMLVSARTAGSLRVRWTAVGDM